LLLKYILYNTTSDIFFKEENQTLTIVHHTLKHQLFSVFGSFALFLFNPSLALKRLLRMENELLLTERRPLAASHRIHLECIYLESKLDLSRKQMDLSRKRFNCTEFI
jgi:hypothetical protein